MKEAIKIKITENNIELEQALQIRSKVFQEEQLIPRELDFDGKDERCDHFIAYFEGVAVGTGRLRFAFDKIMIVRVERLAVLREFRGRGIGKGIMQKMHEYMQEKNVMEVNLQVQEPLKGFYEKLGYVQVGEDFLEFEKPHVEMRMSFE